MAEPGKVTVYSFDVFDMEGRCFMPFKATREDIESHYNGMIIAGTDEEIPVSALDSEGHYRRWSGWTEQHFALVH